MKCRKCGHVNKDNATFCESCGTPLKKKNILKPIIIIIIIFFVLLCSVVGGVLAYSHFTEETVEENVVETTKKNKEIDKDKEEDSPKEPESEEEELEDDSDADEQKKEEADSQVNATESEVTPKSAEQTYVKCFVKNVSGNLNMRTLPSHESGLAGVITTEADVLYYTGETGQGYGSDGVLHDWYKVTTASGVYGWVRSDLVREQ